MSKRYVDNSNKENRVDFVFRKHGMSVAIILALMSIPLILITALYLFDIYNRHINIEINALIVTVVTIFLIFKIRYFKRLVNRVEFQNAIFANALNHNTEFCLIVYKDGRIIYADARFYERFKDYKQDINLDNILETGGIVDQKKKVFYKALKNNSSIQTYFSICEKGKTSNFLLSLNPVPVNQEIALDNSKTYNLSFVPIARPQGYFVLKATRPSKEQLYEKLMETHNVGVYWLNSNGIIMSANQSFLTMLELENFKKDTLFTDFIAKVKDKEQIKGGEITLCTMNGIPFKAYINYAVFYDKYNSQYTCGLVTPVTLSINDYQLNPCFIDAPIAIAQCDIKGNLIKKNNALLKFIKQKNIDSIFTLIANDCHKKIKEYFENNSINNMTADVQLQDGSDMKVYLSKFIHNNVFIICYFIDNTEHKSLEMKFEHYQKMQAIGQLAGGIAHDFNNILTAIIGFGDLLLTKHPAGDQSFSDIMQIQQNAKRGSNLVKQLLAFSRKQTLQSEILDINNIIADLSQMIQRLIGENIEFTIEYGQDDVLVKADQGQLEQVIINLVVNSCAAMEKGGKLIIKTFKTKIDSKTTLMEDMFLPDKESIEYGEYIVIEVIDNGCGIKKDVIDKIFEPFFSTKDIKSGTGLGLSTVYGIVKQTGGYVIVSSKEGIGSRFSIFLPAVYVLESNKIKTIKNEFIENTVTIDTNNSGTILLIEDEDPVRVFSTRALANKGYDIIEANSGRRALAIIKEKINEIDIIISDVVMPEVSGPEIVKEAIKIRPDIKVIFISGYAEDAFLKNEDIDVTKFHFLPKPFTLNELTIKVKEVLESKN